MTLNERLLRLALILSGLLLVVIGLNLALGGIRSMGWHMPVDFMTVTDDLLFRRHDNNVRFFGGVFFALSVLVVLAGLWPRRLRWPVVAFLLAIPAGSVFRILAPGFDVFGDDYLAASILAELILCPLLALWLWRLH